MSTKRFHKSDSLTYSYLLHDAEKYDFQTPNEFNGFPVVRQFVSVYAGTGYSWRTIAEEYRSLRVRVDGLNLPMRTCAVEYHDFIVALTVRGFSRALEKSNRFGRISMDQQIDWVAKELVAMRDYTKYMEGDGSWYANPENARKFEDFWPKD